jgi:hypothetical protein
VSFRPGPAGAPVLQLRLRRGQGLRLRTAPEADLDVSLARFASAPTASLPPLRGSAVLKIPTDRSSVPWLASIPATSPLLACPA